MIREYAIYLRDLIPDGRMYWELNSFIQTGRIKDLISTSDNDITKAGILNSKSDRIRHYLREHVLSYEQFLIEKRDFEIDKLIGRGAE
jgi:hypothetical protein